MKNKFLCIGLSLLLGITHLSACNNNPVKDLNLNNNETNLNYVDVLTSQKKVPQGKYNEGVVLVKSSNFNNSMLGELKYDTVNQLYKNSVWYEIKLLKGESTEEAVNYLSELNFFEKVDFDYVMGSDGEIESIDISSNPWSGDEKHLDNQGIKEAWKYLRKEGKNPGGSSDVIVAVIDTGVDYNHIDLRNNIWTNSAEIPNNGIDDDGNGYIDDYYGWDCVGNDNDPMDDNGHGTHVAGIISAENNSEGIVGVAFNCKVMSLKAGNSSGYFNNSDIAEAIQYAYMNGASVINMSFGGSIISSAVEEALEDAYNQCVLIAAAGNDGLCNNLNHEKKHDVGISYPAALPYVIGVMSTNNNGTTVSPFSNYDDTPYNSVEYEVYACGEQVSSTWPNNKIAKLSGTSMAAPVVSGIAALLRSNYQDRDIYSNKYIQSQIVNTGTVRPYNNILKEIDYGHSFANVYEAIVNAPKPLVNLYDFYIFDNIEFDSSNNGDGIIDAGETIRLAIELYNRGGVASNVTVGIDTIRNEDSSLVDPYFTIKNSTISLGDIGTYSVRDCGKRFNDDKITGTEKYFEIKVLESCPNNYFANFNVIINYSNGLDANDKTEYANVETASLTVNNGFVLPQIITEDTTFENDKLYIVANSVVIPEDVTVTFKKGCKIQFYSSFSSYYLDGIYRSPSIDVYGKLIFDGAENDYIDIYPSDEYFNLACLIIRKTSSSVIEMKYTNVTNLCTGYNGSNEGQFNVTNSNLLEDLLKVFSDGEGVQYIENSMYSSARYLSFSSLKDSYISCERSFGSIVADTIDGCYLKMCSNRQVEIKATLFKNNVLSSKGATDNTAASFVSSFGICENNAFISYSNNNPADILHLDFKNCVSSNNYFSYGYKMYALQVFDNFYLENGHPSINLLGDCSNYELLYPFVKNVEIFDIDGNKIDTVGRDKFTLRVEFSREMDTTYNPNIYFGSMYPYTDYKIIGEYVTPLVWEGEYSIKAFIENGNQKIRITYAYAKDENSNCLKGLVDNSNSFSFEIDTTSALSMDLQAFVENDGIHLAWVQDDYDTLMGYNVYRSSEKDGNYIKLNSSVIPENEHTFVDNNAEPGKTYWYTFTVVFSDMTESTPAGKISCTASDTISPNIYHTPINQGYLNNNLVISCTASDNIGVQDVTLYYRTKGNCTWKSLEMLRQNDKFSATIFGSELTLDGIEYYIVANDGYNTISKGSAENPYNVIIKDASSISRLGDVDGDGVITTKDALMIMQAINGDLLLSDDQFRRADLNSDGTLSSVEALRILQYINGNVSSLEM